MKRRVVKRPACGVVALGVLLGFQVPAHADPVADFYKGKTVAMVVSSAAGGGYDYLARTIAKHMFVHIPGKPAMVVRNMPGAGGVIAANFVAGNAGKDGLTIASVQNNVVFEPLFANKRAKYNPVQMNWIGTPSVETGLLVVLAGHRVNSIQDAMKTRLRAGASGYSSAPAMYARLFNRILGTKLDVVIGFRGQTGAFQAMEKGDIDTYGVSYWSSLVTTKKKWVRDRKVRILLQFGPLREKALGNVPHAADLIKKPDDRALLEASYLPLKMGRPFVMGANVPPDRVAAMRKAFVATLADPLFRKEAKRRKLVINQPRDGQTLQREVIAAYKAPPAVIARLRRIANPPKKK